MFAPSKATPAPTFRFPTVPNKAKSLGLRLNKMDSPANHRLTPSKAIPPQQIPPAGNVPCEAPSLARSFVIDQGPVFAIQMLEPSKAIEPGKLSVPNTPNSSPSLALNLVAPPWLRLFATQMFVPSKAKANGFNPALNVPRTAPSLTRTFVTVPDPSFATHILVPSNAIPAGFCPAVMVCN